ncbi:SDR family oxidoreductase [Litoribacter ruber]|uniref:SDR family oxidoreductase n=1 Tax=Litoribacter ruber TaxID=702568 RepID=UPI001BD94FC6|nr:SDR family oxidoreductase [Litoribacter ruber]MBT0810393.1 SDR family oxidoreductase [Litoribacter ruber]
MKGNVALITGGSSGIGYGIAQELLKKGVNVGITGRDKGRIEEAARKLEGLGGEVLPIQADVREFEAQQNAVKAVTDEWGRLDYFVANAGLGHFGSIEELTPEQWSETIDTNLTGVFYSIKAALEPLKASKGYFITISSLAGTNFFAGGSAYNASKFGLTGFTQAIMLDLRDAGIRVSTIMPGSVATNFNNHKVSDEDAWKIQIEDIGEMVVGLFELNSRTLPSKIEVRPSMPPKK